MTTPPLPQLTSIMAIADRFPDGTYGATVNAEEGLSFSMTGPRARRYALALFEAATACEHDAALYHALACKGIPDHASAAILINCRAARPGVNRWTAPLRISAILTAASPHLPVLVVETDGGAWQWAPADARQHARQVLESVTAAEEDNRLAEVLREGLGLEEEVVAAVIDHMQGHWPDSEDGR